MRKSANATSIDNKAAENRLRDLVGNALDPDETLIWFSRPLLLTPARALGLAAMIVAFVFCATPPYHFLTIYGAYILGVWLLVAILKTVQQGRSKSAYGLTDKRFIMVEKWLIGSKKSKSSYTVTSLQPVDLEAIRLIPDRFGITARLLFDRRKTTSKFNLRDWLNGRDERVWTLPYWSEAHRRDAHALHRAGLDLLADGEPSGNDADACRVDPADKTHLYEYVPEPGRLARHWFQALGLRAAKWLLGTVAALPLIIFTTVLFLFPLGEAVLDFVFDNIMDILLPAVAVIGVLALMTCAVAAVLFLRRKNAVAYRFYHDRLVIRAALGRNKDWQIPYDKIEEISFLEHANGHCEVKLMVFADKADGGVANNLRRIWSGALFMPRRLLHIPAAREGRKFLDVLNRGAAGTLDKAAISATESASWLAPGEKVLWRFNSTDWAEKYLPYLMTAICSVGFVMSVYLTVSFAQGLDPAAKDFGCAIAGLMMVIPQTLMMGWFAQSSLKTAFKAPKYMRQFVTDRRVVSMFLGEVSYESHRYAPYLAPVQMTYVDETHSYLACDPVTKGNPGSQHASFGADAARFARGCFFQNIDNPKRLDRLLREMKTQAGRDRANMPVPVVVTKPAWLDAA